MLNHTKREKKRQFYLCSLTNENAEGSLLCGVHKLVASTIESNTPDDGVGGNGLNALPSLHFPNLASLICRAKSSKEPGKKAYTEAM